jgi:hypothetical protein
VLALHAAGILALAKLTAPQIDVLHPVGVSLFLTRLCVPVGGAMLLTLALWLWSARQHRPAALGQSFILSTWLLLGLMVTGELSDPQRHMAISALRPHGP